VAVGLYGVFGAAKKTTKHIKKRRSPGREIVKTWTRRKFPNGLKKF